jgi:hypothetical protein
MADQHLRGVVSMDDATPESWRPVVGYEDQYEVSDQGRVRRFLRVRTSVPGYRTVTFHPDDGRNTTIFVHVLVAEAFIGPRPPGMQVNHKDANKQNNHPSNLEWVTPRGNIQHASSMGLLPDQRGERGHGAKLTWSQVSEIRRLHGQLTQKAIAELFGVSSSLIGLIHRGKAWVE